MKKTNSPALQGMVTVCGVPNCFNPQKRVYGEAPAFRTLAEIKAEVCRMAKVPGFWSAGGTLLWNHQTIPQKFWDKITAAPGDRIDFVAAPAGKAGNFLLKIVGAVAMLVGAILAPMSGGTSLMSFSTMGYALMAGGLALSIAADYIAPLPTPNIGLNQPNDKSASPTYSLNGSSNAMRYGQPIPRIYGRYRVPPTRILDDYTELQGQEEYLNFVGVIGYGPLAIDMDTVRIGDNDLDNYGIEIYNANVDDQDAVIQITEGVLDGNGKPVQQEVIDHVAFQNSFQHELQTRDVNGQEIEDHEQWWINESLGYEVTSISFDLQAPQGIYHMNDKAERESRSVKVEMQYRRIDLEEDQPWASASGTIKKAATTKEAYKFYSEAGVSYSTHSRNDCYVTLDNGLWVGTASKSATSICKLHHDWTYASNPDNDDEDWYSISEVYSDALAAINATSNPTISGYGTVVLPSYSYVGTKVYTLTGIKDAPQNAIRKTFTIKNLPRGQYEMRVRRQDVQSDSTKDVGTVYWTALRGFNKSEKLYTGKKALSMIGLRVKATNQLSGNLPVISVIATSKLRKHNGKTASDSGWASNWNKAAAWATVGETRNPAAIFLDILTGTANERPKPDSQIDFDSLSRWSLWCDENNYTCDMVFDTQTNVWDALQQVCACGRGSPTLIGGKWGVVWAHKQTDIVGHITARNTRGFSSSKTYLSELHGLHVTFQDEDNDYEDSVIDVYAPGYRRSNASLFEGIELNGITNETQAAYMGQFRLNQTLLLPEQYSVTMPLEYMRLRKNDLVRVVREEIGYGIGAANLVSWTEENGSITSLKWDAPLSMTPGRTYVAVIRLGDGSELSCTGSASDGMNFDIDPPVAYTVAPRRMDLVMVGTATTVGRTCIVTSIKPQENLTAQVTLMDYVDGLYENDGGPVPAYEPCITIAGKLGRKLKAPTITGTRSDEWALSTTGEPRLYVKWKYNDKSTSAYVQYREVTAGIAGPWELAGSVINGKSIYIEPVEESWLVQNGKLKSTGITYDVRVQATDAEKGYTSPWSEIKTGITITGRTTIPPDVGTVTAARKSPDGIRLSWPKLNVRDISYYQVSGALEGETATPSIILQPWEMTGVLNFSVIAVDSLGLTSKNKSTASIEIFAPYAPTFSTAHLLDEGIVATYTATTRSWPIGMYEISRGDVVISTEDKMIVMPVPVSRDENDEIVKFDRALPLYARARDIFKNWSEESSPKQITIYYPQAPQPHLGFDKRNGAITVDWQDCQNTHDGAPRIDHYEIAGTLTTQQASHAVEKVAGTHFESFAKLTAYEYGARTVDGIQIMVGTISITVTAVDKYGITDKDKPGAVDNTVTLEVLAPYNPTGFSYTASAEGDIILSWNDCESTFAIDYYIVRDKYNGKSWKQYKTKSNNIALPARKEGTYEVTVQAYDVLGKESARMTYNMVVGGVGGMEVTARIDGADILLEWSIPDASFTIDYYVIKRDNDIIPDEETITFEDGDQIGTAKVNYFRVPGGAAGSYTYYVWAVDVAGNISTNYASYASVTIDAPLDPVPSAKLDGNGVKVSWEQPMNETRLTVVAWDVIRQWDETQEGGVVETKEMDYGRVDANTITVPAFAIADGDHSFLVRAIDAGGNAGTWGEVTFIVEMPGEVVITDSLVIDNNVQIYWTEPTSIFFPIREYLFSEIDSDGYEMLIGTVDALFAFVQELANGDYTYGIRPVDAGGNVGPITTRSVKVSQPPDFVFYHDLESLFNGTKTNMVLDGHGHMLGPVPDGETWEENVARATSLAGTTIETHKQKSDAGYTTWLEPNTNTGTYVEVVHMSNDPQNPRTVAASNISVTLTARRISGSPVYGCKIETSLDGTTWETAAENSFNVYAANFAHVRYTITVTGGYAEISGIHYSINVKRKHDYGQAYCAANDNGAGWISEQATPMLTGTWIPFSTKFSDVSSIEYALQENLAVLGLTAFLVFEDVPDPQGFRIFIKDKNGVRQSGTVDWSAIGV